MLGGNNPVADESTFIVVTADIIDDCDSQHKHTALSQRKVMNPEVSPTNSFMKYGTAKESAPTKITLRITFLIKAMESNGIKPRNITNRADRQASDTPIDTAKGASWRGPQLKQNIRNRQIEHLQAAHHNLVIFILPVASIPVISGFETDSVMVNQRISCTKITVWSGIFASHRLRIYSVLRRMTEASSQERKNDMRALRNIRLFISLISDCA